MSGKCFGAENALYMSAVLRAVLVPGTPSCRRICSLRPTHKKAKASRKIRSFKEMNSELKHRFLSQYPGGGYLGQFLPGMCSWPLKTPTPL